MNEKTKQNLSTNAPITWCPGCTNFMILEAVKQTLTNFIDSKKFKQTDFAIATDIGCHAKIFDYLNISGLNCLHGRALPTAIGMKIGNPNLKILTFAGDGAVYSEGIEHLVHAFRYNSDLTLILHDNQSFSLTTGQPAPTTQQGYISKSEPLGVFDKPFNPLKIALASGATFVARTSARDIPHMVEIFTKAINHKGFSFVEVIQDCLIFNTEANNKEKFMYKISDCHNKQRAEKLADEFDYNSKEGKIPIGVIYQVMEPALEEKWPQLKELLENKKNWKSK
ncbi:MAG: thiamine pyrophosphate-dependent enzyme [Candidatus Pacearchaeota archaeon]